MNKLKSNLEALSLYPRASFYLAKKALARLITLPEQIDTHFADAINGKEDEV